MTPSISADDVLEQLPWLRAFAARLASPADVDDLVSQTWIAAWQQGATVEVDPRGPRPWLGAVLRNKARMLQRERSRRRARETKAAAVASDVVDADLTRLSVLSALVTAIRRLPEEDQAMVVQRYCEGRTSTEIGAALGLGAATVRSRLKRSLARLRSDLDERHGGQRAAWAGAVGAGVLPAASGASTALMWGVGLAVAAAAVTAVVVARGASDPEAPVEAAAVMVDAPREEGGERELWEARKARVLAANDAFERSARGSERAGEAGQAAAGEGDVAQLVGEFAALQQGVFDGCVADVSLSRDTAFVVRSEVVGAPGVGTVVAAVELEDGAEGAEALLECVREGMYVLHGAAPPEPFEAEMSFGLGNPAPQPSAEADEEVVPVDATEAQQASVRRQAQGAADCAGEEEGSAVLLLAMGDDGAVGQVRFEETTLSLGAVDCVADHALANWTLDAQAGERLRVRVAFPAAQVAP